jgi:hypothetical protein
MKLVKNDSSQAFTVFLQTEKGCKEVHFPPGHSIVVPDHYISEQVKTLFRRRVFKITNA